MLNELKSLIKAYKFSSDTIKRQALRERILKLSEMVDSQTQIKDQNQQLTLKHKPEAIPSTHDMTSSQSKQVPSARGGNLFRMRTSLREEVKGVQAFQLERKANA